MAKENNLKIRMSNFEILRIICMILIVAHHFAWHSSLSVNTPVVNKRIMDALVVGGKIAVNVYVLISGYFMIESKFKWEKVLRLFLQLLFYSVGIYLVLVLFKCVSFDLKSFRELFFPIYTYQYWFMSFFMLLYFLSPYLNKMLKNCNQKELLLLILVLLIFQLDTTIAKLHFSVGNLVWFITLYIIAAYLRLYSNKLFNNKYSMLVTLIISLVFIIYQYSFKGINYWNMNKGISLICSLSLFLFFKNLDIKNNKVINLISSATLGVYLIHDNGFIRPLLWNKWINVPSLALKDSLWIYSILIIIGVYLICTLIELLRKYIEGIIIRIIKKKKVIKRV